MRRVFFTRVSEGLEEDFGGFDSRGFTRVLTRTLEGFLHEGFRGFGGGLWRVWRRTLEGFLHEGLRGLWRVWSTRIHEDFGGFGPRGFTRVSKSAGDLKIPPPFWFWFFPAFWFLVFGFWFLAGNGGLWRVYEDF